MKDICSTEQVGVGELTLFQRTDRAPRQVVVAGLGAILAWVEEVAASGPYLLGELLLRHRSRQLCPPHNGCALSP